MQYVNVLGVRVSPLPLAGVLEAIDRWIKDDTVQYICCTSVNGVMASQHDPQIRRTINWAGLVVPDGMPLVWLVRWAGYPDQDRVYGPDLLLAVCARGQEKGYSHFFYGGAPGVAERLVANLGQRFPDIRVAGVYSPPFRALTVEEDEAVIERINRANPDIVWMGISTPKQDLWMFEHYKRLRAKVCIGVGAAFDFHSGLVRQAPRWIQRSGFEWAYRFWQEPRRLWRRYLLGNPAFIFLVALQLLGIRRYE